MIALFLDIVVVVISLIFLFFASYYRLFSGQTKSLQKQKSWGTVLATSFNKTAKVNNNNNINNNNNNTNINNIMPSTTTKILEQPKGSKMLPTVPTKHQMLFEDPEFPAIWQSIYCDDVDSDLPSPKGIIWKRPWEITNCASFLRNNQTDNLTTNNFQLKDIVQGQLRNCWLTSALLALMQSEENFNFVINPTLNNKLDNENYIGKFIFNFTFKEDIVREVIIDDLLPLKNGQLLFMHSSDGIIFWAALLEKAFAKLYGSYAALENTNHYYRALRLLIGPKTSFKLYMLRDITRSQLIHLFSERISDVRQCRFCCTVSNGFIEKKAHAGRGILVMRSFSIIDFIEDRRRNNYLIKIRNPWSRITSTNTKSNSIDKNSPKWEYVSPRFRGIVQKIENGSFILALDSFLSFFNYIEWWQSEEDNEEEEENNNKLLNEKIKKEEGKLNKKQQKQQQLLLAPPPSYEATLKVEI